MIGDTEVEVMLVIQDMAMPKAQGATAMAAMPTARATPATMAPAAVTLGIRVMMQVLAVMATTDDDNDI